jgi:hypothetical protein
LSAIIVILGVIGAMSRSHSLTPWWLDFEHIES